MQVRALHHRRGADRRPRGVLPAGPENDQGRGARPHRDASGNHQLQR
ncbi:Uncharacterised protein [Bordetella pertussis]|nr:Uncharacterised protein [Bordetella pertussis]